jgi:predicted O-methyltransferase YrrM
MTTSDRDPLVSWTQGGPPFWLTAASYWMPTHFYETRAWVTHAPFAFWLMDVLRPRSIVELGTHYGFSCFVFAEAARRLSLEATITALDSWVGDDQAGAYGERVYQSVRETVDRDYPDTVRLLRGWFEESRPRIADGSVDLLHIDGRHGYEDVLADYTSWRSTVRDGGIVLFHDIAEHQEGFGVWRLWDELTSEHRTFTFEHGHGLGVLAVGEPPAGPLAALFDADEATAASIRTEYEQLGAAVARQADLDALPAELEAIFASRSWRLTRPLRDVAWKVRSRKR